MKKGYGPLPHTGLKSRLKKFKRARSWISHISFSLASIARLKTTFAYHNTHSEGSYLFHKRLRSNGGLLWMRTSPFRNRTLTPLSSCSWGIAGPITLVPRSSILGVIWGCSSRRWWGTWNSAWKSIPSAGITSGSKPQAVLSQCGDQNQGNT